MSDLKGPFQSEVTHHNHTASGTKYEVCKWRCPQCQHARSTLYIDGEWCHGDSFCVSLREGVEVQQCGTCWSAAPLGAVAVDAAPQTLNVEQMLRECVPGGTVCDPQQVADAIRLWFGHQVGAPVGLSDAANPASPWIAVSERLPIKFDEVLIAFRDSTLPATGQYTESARDHDGWCYPSENDPDEVGPITHWMPLPAPPAEAPKEHS